MFITFEGPEGSGKSSQIPLLAAYLRKLGRQVLVTREPGGTSIGDQIRSCLHDVDNTAMDPATEFLLYSASRAQLVQEVIRPALAAGQMVLCDRFADSSIAYQGYGRGLDLEALQRITRFAADGLAPDITFLLDIDVEKGLARRIAANEEMNRLDLEEVAFHRRVREGYHQLVQGDPGRWCVVDADRPRDALQADLQRLITERLKEIASTRIP